MRFPVRLLDDEGLRRFVFSEFHGAGFEVQERDLLAALMKPSDLFVDVGAHFGLFSLVLAEIFPDLSCLAVEPSPENFDILAENIRFNALADRITIVQCAVGDRTGRATLRLNSSMGHHLSREPVTNSQGAIEVDLLTLDALVAEHAGAENQLRPIWLKIDTEGREADALKGAVGLFQAERVKGVLWEFRVGHLINPDKEDIFRFFGEFGFRSFQISDSNIISVLDPVLQDRLTAMGF